MKLVENEIKEGFDMEFNGTVEEARKKWNDVPIGKTEHCPLCSPKKTASLWTLLSRS
jgi:hypothetical protein